MPVVESDQEGMEEARAISLSDNEYQIIKPPVGIEVSTKPEALYLGKSEKGVYYALVDDSDQICQLRVWILKKMCDQLEWVLIHQTDPGSILARQKHERRQINNRPWILNDINYRRRRGEDGNRKAVVPEKFEWDSDNDNVIQAEDGVEEYNEFIDFLGFHPYKEVVFLSESYRRGLAYHLNSSKVQELGNLYPTNYGKIAGQHQLIRESYPYTTCWMESVLQVNNLSCLKFAVANKVIVCINNDILDDVLPRLAPRDLSVLRCVRKAWRAAVEGRRLLLPRYVGGIFIWWNNLDSLEYLARPTTGTAVSGRLDFMTPEPRFMSTPTPQDHCNGLLLFRHCVVNPATRRCAPLAPRPPQLRWSEEIWWREGMYFYHKLYLVFDPAVPPHHEVFAIPKILDKPSPGERRYGSSQDKLDPTIENSEWPPSPWNLFVFSSKTGQWEERSFVREGSAAGTVASMRWSASLRGEGHYAAYWQGELYVHYDADFFIRSIEASERSKSPPCRGPARVSVDPSINSRESEQEIEAEMGEPDLVALLPDDTLADVLRRLAPRDLAASRCVRRAWRGVIDDRRLLRPFLLPHKVGGIFIKFYSHSFWELFSRPSTGPTVSGWFDFFPDGTRDVDRPPRLDHCNGLFLFKCDHVFNPATRRWASLPPRPPPAMAAQHFFDDPYLVFDPAISPHYEVFLVPRILIQDPRRTLYRRDRDGLDPAIEAGEWPPSPCIMQVFSSRTGEWEQRSYIREGEAAGTVADVRFDSLIFEKRYAVSWRGELYVHCEAQYVMRVSLLNNKFQVIKPPVDSKESSCKGLYLGRSKGGVHCALVDNWDHPCRLRVWILQESGGKMEWVLKHQSDIGPMLPYDDYHEPIGGPWMLQDINYYHRRHKYYGKKEAAVQEKLEWDSDDDNVLQNCHGDGEGAMDIAFLGFHPYKDVVFLTESARRGLAYHLNSSKIQLLGNIYPKERVVGQFHPISECFPYTPCWMGELPLGN
ncbi:hypothetical protein BAE44_0008972 [Dichanthelium oligosanthes]|uniref:F-box domain-containing protein n=1 Tax=Dichanthelium oligosanthes TaxID=888268 RepID=A0A1E5VY16_9POAL|nr:hypothetical protein BAE44_0008972 [Dichanthelium oligosanthes]